MSIFSAILDKLGFGHKTDTTAAATPVPDGPRLADTGLDVRLSLGFGLALMAGGAALRLRLR